MTEAGVASYAEVVSSSTRSNRAPRKRRGLNASRRQHPDRVRRNEMNQNDRTALHEPTTQPPHISDVADDDQQFRNIDELEHDDRDQGQEDLAPQEPREFHFDINSDARSINEISDDHASRAAWNPLTANTAEDASSAELTSEYILSKLYNYMKISEMSTYGIRVFEMTFSSYLPYLSEDDLLHLATSYWCNGQHFNCMAAHRGRRIKSAASAAPVGESSAAFPATQSQFDSLFGPNRPIQRGAGNDLFALRITPELLDAAMTSGASVDKIEAMLLQKRRDEGVPLALPRSKSKRKSQHRFYTQHERNFFSRNLNHRFWNHEVLVRVFTQNGWMTPNLADYALKTFIKNIFHHVAKNPSGGACTWFLASSLRAFFVSFFGLDDIPEVYRAQVAAMKAKRHGKINDETMRRWCELVELLASRGASKRQSQRSELMLPLQYALRIGRNTFKFTSSSHREKNRTLIPEHFEQYNIFVPDDMWDVVVAYL